MENGRPTAFNTDVADAICDRLAGGESLRAITADEAMPGETTVRRWLASEDALFGEFRRQYACAREAQGDNYAERVVDDAMAAEDAALGRLRMDALKWAASKLAPKKYGDKIGVEISDETSTAALLAEARKRAAG